MRLTWQAEAKAAFTCERLFGVIGVLSVGNYLPETILLRCGAK